MLDKLIGAYKNRRKQGFLDLTAAYKHKYAFVGVGNHSIVNLYSVIDYLRVPLKYIVTRTENNAVKMAGRYGAEGTTDLDRVLNDPEIKGVFVCSDPGTHFDLARRILSKGKALFIEKPPCLTSEELAELITLSKDKIAVVGLQKRYSVVNSYIRKQIQGGESYNYRYGLGLYPEGDPLLDLFIHPIDNVVHLFGRVKSMHVVVAEQGKGSKTYHAVLEHEKGAVGNLELSTGYTWTSGVDELIVKTGKRILRADYPDYLESETKSGSLAGIPLEKVLGSSTEKNILFQNHGKQPVLNQNNVFVQGYFDEVKTFIDLCEGKKSENRSDLASLKETYVLIDRLSKQ